MAGYGDDQGFTDWLTSNGYSLPDGAPSAAVLRQRGSIYIDGTFGARFPGVPVGGIGQDRAWPRSGAVDVYGNAIDPGTVPQLVINAAYEAALMEANDPGSLAVTFDPSQRTKRLKAGSAEIEYFDPTKGGDVFAPNAPVSSVIEGILYPLIGPPFLAPAIMVV